MGNFRIEPPGLFRGRGEHPKMGKIKKRIYPRDVTINIGEGVPIPEHPYPGEPARQLAGSWQVATAGCIGRLQRQVEAAAVRTVARKAW